MGGRLIEVLRGLGWNVLVSDHARGSGIGQKLLDEAERLAADRGCDRMEKLARGWTYDSSATKYRDKVLSIVKSIEEDMVEDRSMIDFIERERIDLGR